MVEGVNGEVTLARYCQALAPAYPDIIKARARPKEIDATYKQRFSRAVTKANARTARTVMHRINEQRGPGLGCSLCR